MQHTYFTHYFYCFLVFYTTFDQLIDGDIL